MKNILNEFKKVKFFVCFHHTFDLITNTVGAFLFIPFNIVLPCDWAISDYFCHEIKADAFTLKLKLFTVENRNPVVVSRVL